MPGNQLQIWPGLISRIACLLPSKRAIVRIIPDVLPLRLAFHGRVRSSYLLFLVNSDTARENLPIPSRKSRRRCGRSTEFLPREDGTFYLKSKKKIISGETQLRSSEDCIIPECCERLSNIDRMLCLYLRYQNQIYWDWDRKISLV